MADRRLALAVALGLALATTGCPHGGGSGGIDPDAPPGDQPAFPLVEGHVRQADIAAGTFTFQELFDMGDELFEAAFNGVDGAGALALPNGDELPSRFSRVPPGGGRFTGPNAQACVACHNAPLPTSAGEAAANVLQDPARDGQGPFNVRNATSLFGAGVLQVLAQEITEALGTQRAFAEAGLGLAPGDAITTTLAAKGIDYGTLRLVRGPSGEALVDPRGLCGVDPDLVVRPYGWKGDVTTLRGFVRGAFLNEMGMEPEELVAKMNDALDPLLGQLPAMPDDPDQDGVGGEEPEISVGDVTATTLYVAAQEVPQHLGRLVQLGLAPPAPGPVGALIARGEVLFDAIGCAECHIPELQVDVPVFEEPTLAGLGRYIDEELRATDPGYDPSRPARFHLVREGDAPRLVPGGAGARARIFGDLRRHFMGVPLMDAQPQGVTGADGRPVRATIEDPQSPGEPLEVTLAVDERVFLTAELWGTGNAGPWLHDGRAGTLEEAILLHGVDDPGAHPPEAIGEAQPARDAFAALPADDRLAVVEFLRSLLHFAFPEEGE